MRDYEDSLREATRTATLGAGATGLVAGGVASMLAGKRRAALIARDAVLTALGAGALAGGGTHLGGKVLGPSKPDDTGQFTRRGSVGAGIAGTGLGAALGGAAAGGAFKPHTLPNNLVGDYLRKLAAKRSLGRVLKGAGLGGAALGGLGAYLGASEGMGVDFIAGEKRRLEDPNG